MAGNATAQATTKAAGLTLGKVVNFGFDAFDVGSTIFTNLKEGHGIIRSLGAAAVDQALWTFAPALQWTRMGIDIVSAIGSGVKNYAETTGKANASKQSAAYASNFGGRYVDSQQGYTMRQRGMNALQNSSTNVNSVLGNEARTYFRGVY